MPSRYAHSFQLAVLATLAVAVSGAPTLAQELKMPADPLAGMVVETDAPPAASGSPQQLSPMGASPLSMGSEMGMAPMGATSAQASGGYYNPTLGSHIRARYNTQSYGQQAGTLDLGTMKLIPVDGGMAFIDGQVTMNDESHVGYNLGVGYRWMTLPLFPNSPDDAKIMGVSLWSDGQTVGGENFFPQIGASLEFLGDRIDFRANGYTPVGPQTKTRDFTLTGDPAFSGNALGQLLQGVQDTALTVAEAELAGRIANLDAWVFGGVYGLKGGAVDAVGGKVGLRGYATPDLLLSVAIANDEEFDTNALFSATWFIGRTRVENCPTGKLSDRLREPVYRNDYVATQQSVAYAPGVLFQNGDGEQLRFVHVDSTAAPGGDGTFENPLNSLDDINANSQTDDLVLAHGGSVFNGQTATLLDGQSFIGEGANLATTVSTRRFGTITLPETAVGAQAGAVPTINGSPAAGIVLADNNVVQNMAFDGGVNAIITDAVNGSHNSTLQDLTISNTTGDAIALTAAIVADADDVDGDSNLTETVNLLGSVAIDNVTFSNSGGNDIAIDADTGASTQTLAEQIAISNVTTSGNAAAPSIAISNTNAVNGSSASISNFTYNGGATGQGGLLLTNTGSATTVTESDFNEGVGPAVSVNGNTGTVVVGGTNTITNVTGRAVEVIGNTAAVTVGAEISTDAAFSGGGVFVQSNEATVAFNGAITANNFDAVTIDDAQAAVNFGAEGITSNGTGAAVTITGAGDNTTDAAEITFNGDIVNEQGFVADVNAGDDGIVFNGTVTDTGAGVRVRNRADDVAASVLFNDQTDITTSGANNAVTLQANGDASTVAFTALDIVTDVGVGVFGANGGGLNISGAGNTISTQTGRAIDLAGGSSGTGLTFESVDTNGADQAIVLDDFDGDVTVNGGTMATTGLAVEATNSGVTLNDVTIDSIANQAVAATVTDDADRTVALTDSQLNGGSLAFQTNNGATGSLNASVDNGGSPAGASSQVGAVSFSSAGSGNNTLNMTDVTTTAGFDYDAANSSTLAVGMTRVTGNGNVTFDTVGSGSSSINLDDVDTTGGDFAYTTGGTSSLAVDMDTVEGAEVSFDSNSTGNSSIAIRDSTTTGGFDYDVDGSGNLSATMTTVTGAGDVTLDVTSGGNGLLTMTTVNTGGALTANSTAGSDGDLVVTATNSGNTTAFTGITVNDLGDGAVATSFNNVSSTAGIDYDSAGAGSASLSVSGGNYDGDIDALATNTGTFTTTFNGSTNVTNGDVSLVGQNTGAFTSNLTGTTATGLLTVSKNNNGASTINLDNLDFGDGIDVDSLNTGTLAFTMQDVSIDTGDNVTGVSLNFGQNITSGTVDIFGANDITTSDGTALDVNFLGGNVQFRLANSTYLNNSGTLSAVDVSVANGARIDATVTGNTFTNQDGGGPVEFVIATIAGGSPVLNIDINSNNAISAGGGAGSGEYAITEGAGGDVNVYELDDTFDNNRNTGTFNPDNRAALDDLANPPAQP